MSGARGLGWSYDTYARPDHTRAGRKNFDTLASLASVPPTDRASAARMADALAGLLAEITPVQRDVLSGKMTRLVAAPGRVNHWRLPPGLVNDEQARRKWAALVLLDCVDFISDQMAATHSLEEREEWRRKARLYTAGAENYPVPLV